MKPLDRILQSVHAAIAGADRSGLVMRALSHPVLRAFLFRSLRRTPFGFVGTILLRKALMGNGRVFGMDLVSRRQARMTWLAGLVRRHDLFSGGGAKTAQKSGRPAIRRWLSQ